MADQKFLTVQYLNRCQLARLFSKIVVNRETGCWEWISSLTTSGYANVWFHGTMMTAHRVMYAWLVGPVPRGVSRTTQQLDHKACDNPACCNPSHLVLTTPKDNSTRGTRGFAAINTHKKICPRGHDLPETPDRRYGTARRCITCTRDMANKRRQLQRADASAIRQRLPQFCRNGHPVTEPRPKQCPICARKTKRDWKMRQKAKRQAHMGS